MLRAGAAYSGAEEWRGIVGVAPGIAGSPGGGGRDDQGALPRPLCVDDGDGPLGLIVGGNENPLAPGKPEVRERGGGGGVLRGGGRDGAGRACGAVSPRSVALGRDGEGAGIPAAGMGALGRARVFSSSRRCVASSLKM
jgi:hypothetical protein